MDGVRIGEVTHFFSKISVAVITLTDTLRVGDTVHFLGRSTDFRQEVKSLQIEHEQVEEAGSGQEVAIKVERRVRQHVRVFKLTGDE
jgi:putative protease